MYLSKIVNAAASNADSVVNLIMPKIIDNIISPLVQFIFALATLLFIWGLLGYFLGGEDSDKRSIGQQHILWGVIGMAIMISVYGIIRFVASSLGQQAPF